MSSPILFLFVKNLYCPFISRLVQKTCPLLRMCSMCVGLHLLEAKMTSPRDTSLPMVNWIYDLSLSYWYIRCWLIVSALCQPFADQTKRGLLINAPLGLLRDYIFLKELQRIWVAELIVRWLGKLDQQTERWRKRNIDDKRHSLHACTTSHCFLRFDIIWAVCLVDQLHNKKMKNLMACYIKDGGCTKPATNPSRSWVAR